MSISTTKMTVRQFLLLADDPPGVRLELVDGQIAVHPTQNLSHGSVLTMLTYFLVGHIKETRIGNVVGDVGMVFGEYDLRRADLIYIAKERHDIIGKQTINGAPDLCIEILSPTSTRIDRKDKFKQYQDAGVAYYWIVDSEAKTIEAFQPEGRKYRPAGSGKGNQIVQLPPFPDLKIPLGDLWFTRKS